MSGIEPDQLSTPALEPTDPAHAGQAIYTKRFLRFYDLVAWFNGSVAWRCPPKSLIALYNECITARHLEIGVGTGSLLDRCRFPTERPDLTLMDINAAPLATASQRLNRYRPASHQANVLSGFGLDESFDSIGMNWVLHCLPGDIPEKARAFDHCRTVLSPNGVLFGSTVLGVGVTHNRLARWLIGRFNRSGTFSNESDSLLDLEAELRARFDDVRIVVIGSVASFTARATS